MIIISYQGKRRSMDPRSLLLPSLTIHASSSSSVKHESLQYPSNSKASMTMRLSVCLAIDARKGSVSVVQMIGRECKCNCAQLQENNVPSAGKSNHLLQFTFQLKSIHFESVSIQDCHVALNLSKFIDKSFIGATVWSITRKRVLTEL